MRPRRQRHSAGPTARPLSWTADRLAVHLLGLDPAVALRLVEGVRLLPRHVAADRHLAQPAARRPALRLGHQPAPDAAAPAAPVHHQAEDLAPALGFDQVLLGGVDPARQLPVVGHGGEHQLVVASEQALQPRGNGLGGYRIPELVAQRRDGGGVLTGDAPNTGAVRTHARPRASSAAACSASTRSARSMVRR